MTAVMMVLGWLKPLLPTLRKLPLYAYAIGVLLLIVLGQCNERARLGAREYARGVRETRNSARHDSVVVGVINRADSAAKARTDTAASAVRRQTTRVREVIAALPAAVDTSPAVQSLKVACTAVADSADALVRTLDTERELSKVRDAVNDANLTAARITIGALQEENASLKKRWPRRVTVAVGAIGTLGGWLAREYLQRRHP